MGARQTLARQEAAAIARGEAPPPPRRYVDCGDGLDGGGGGGEDGGGGEGGSGGGGGGGGDGSGNGGGGSGDGDGEGGGGGGGGAAARKSGAVPGAQHVVGLDAIALLSATRISGFSDHPHHVFVFGAAPTKRRGGA